MGLGGIGPSCRLQLGRRRRERCRSQTPTRPGKALGSAFRGYAEGGEALSTAGRVKDGDADGWVREWSATAERLEAAAGEAEAAGRRVGARGLYLRASTYFSTALYLITHASAPERQLGLWKRHRACWDKLVDLAPGSRGAAPGSL